MTNEQIRAACERAEVLSTSISIDELRPHAFQAILQALLNCMMESAPSPRSSPADARSVAKNSTVRRPAGLKARIEGLIADGFFVVPRSIGEVAEHLKVAGWNHQTKEISARLIEFARRKSLRRAESVVGGKKIFTYSNW